jgi:hypothetical protein
MTLLASTPAPPSPPRPLRGRTRIVTGALVIMMLADLGATAANLWEAAMIERLLADRDSVLVAEVLASESFYETAAYAQMFALVLTGLIFLIWLDRAAANAERFVPQRYSRTWRLLTWFIPIVCWFFPKQVMDDIWLSSRPGSGRSGLVRAWWAAWLLTTIPPLVASRLLPEEENLESLRTIVLWDVVLVIPSFVAAALAIAMVRRIAGFQEDPENWAKAAEVFRPTGEAGFGVFANPVRALRPIRPFAVAAIVGAVLAGVVSAAYAVADWLVFAGPGTEWRDPAGRWPYASAVVLALVLLASWLARARRNSYTLRPDLFHRYAAFFLLLGWLMPVINLLAPKSMVDDVWKGSTPAGEPYRGWGLVWVWWLSLLAWAWASLISGLVFFFEAEMSGGAHRVLLAAIACLSLVAAALTVAVILAITRLQLRAGVEPRLPVEGGERDG